MVQKNKLSIVIPVFNEQDSIELLLEKILQVMKENNYDFEVLLVDDGSTDNSVKEILTYFKKIKTTKKVTPNTLKLVRLRKNFGKATALQAAFGKVSGDVVVTMDADLQDDPEEIPRMIAKIQQDDLDLVSGWKKNRQDPLEKKLPSKVFNGFISQVSGVKLHDFNCGFKVYRRSVVNELQLYGELHRYIPVLAADKGFRIGEIAVKHHERKFGHSKYNWKRYDRGFFDAISVLFISKYYSQPMYFFGRLGLIFGGIGFLICLYLLIEWLSGASIGGRPLLSFGILMMVIGIQILTLGLIGDMVVKATYRANNIDEKIKEVVE